MNKVSAFFKDCWSDYVDFMGKENGFPDSILSGNLLLSAHGFGPLFSSPAASPRNLCYNAIRHKSTQNRQ